MKLRRYLTFVLWLCWAWTAMTLTHESGHVIAGLTGGARLVEFELRPFHLPHSSFVGDQHPLVTLWAGIVVGCVVPLLGAAVRPRPACWFIAWFCVLSNGVYLMLGLVMGDPHLDATRMVLAGAHQIEIATFSGLLIALGYPLFRKSCIDLLKSEEESMSWRGLAISVVSLLALWGVQFLIGSQAAASI